MSGKPKTDLTNTYVIDDDVMDEMENLEATVVLDDAQKHPTDTDVLSDEFSDTVLLEENRQVSQKNRTGTSSFRDEVMDEMENLEATAEMARLEELPQDDDATAVLRTTRRRKATGSDSS